MIRGKGGFFMQQKEKQKIAVFGTLNILVCCALLAAMSIVCGKYLAFNLTEVLRFSFENLPIILTGIWFGPVAGAVVGAVADIVGSLMVGYGINPLVTVGAAVIGLVSGGVYALTSKFQSHKVSVALGVVSAHLFGSVIVKTVGLSAYYQMPFMLLLAWRAVNYVIIGALELIIIYAVTNNKSVAVMLSRIRRGK